MSKSELTERVWIRISKENKDKLKKQAEENGRGLWPEANRIFTQYFTK